MKKIAKNSRKRLVALILAITFLLSNTLSFIKKDRAQSDFAKNTLSFLLLHEKESDFYEKLEQFNNTYENVSIVYINKDRKVLANPDQISLGKLSKNDLARLNQADLVKIVKSAGFPKTRTYYLDKADNYLIVTMINDLGFYFNWPLLLLMLAIALISFLYINRYVDKLVDSYLDDLSSENIYENINDSKFDEIRPLFKSYTERLDAYRSDANDLSEQLSEFITITSNMKEGFIIFDGHGDIELMNASAKRYLGVDRNTNIKDLINDKEYILALREAKILKRSKSFDIKLNGHFLRIFIDPLQSATKKAFAMIIIDNTEDKKAEQMRREFSANVTHELKSPLTSINGYAELIATGIAKEDDVSKFAEIIYNEGNRLLEIIDDILKISRLDEKNFERDFTEIDIKDVVDDTIEKFARQTSHKNIKVINNIKNFRINTSRSLFYDLVSNIYENAIKYNKIGGTITVDYELKDNSYYLSISDTGVGIAAHDVNRIFERFYVADKSRKRNQKSTGLGLSIVKHIASHLGYEIKVESELDRGSNFIIGIPLQLDREI